MNVDTREMLHIADAKNKLPITTSFVAKKYFKSSAAN